LNFSVRTNITSYNNKIVNIPDPGYFDVDVVRNEVGYPVSSFFGYKVLGLFNTAEEVAAAPTQQDAAPGRFRYLDADKDGTITTKDRVHIGDPNPSFTYGIFLNLDYKGFDLSAFFYGSQGNEIYNSTRSYLHFMGKGYTSNLSNELLNAWTPENMNTSVPKIENTATFSTNGVASSYFVEDGSFLKLKSLALGYTVKPAILQRINISKLRIYAQVANLFTITKYSELDPELGGSTANFGIDGGNYPSNEASIICGIAVTF